MLILSATCWIIHCVGLDVVQQSLEEVFITRGLSACGEMCTKAYCSLCSLSSMLWRIMAFFTQMMKLTSGVSTLFSWKKSTMPYFDGSKDGADILYELSATLVLCNSGSEVCVGVILQFSNHRIPIGMYMALTGLIQYLQRTKQLQQLLRCQTQIILLQKKGKLNWSKG